MHAEIIAIGSELTCGSKLDTNSQWLSRELESLGWTVSRHTTLSDGLESIAEEFRAASRRAEVVLVTGGLGPTLDDITREALGLAFDRPLIRDPESMRQIEALFVARGRVMPERNHRQADRPDGSEAIPNKCGTAPGILMRVAHSDGNSCLFAAMPGVPAEMKPMYEQQIRPHLMTSGMVLCRKVIRTFGYGESDAERMLGDLTARGRNPEVGITASEAVISLWVTARSEVQHEAEQMCDATAGLIRERLGDAVYAEDDSELHHVVAELLHSKNQQMALLESATTGGLLSLWMTESESLSSTVDHAAVIMGDQWLSDLPSLDHWAEEAKRLCDGVLGAHHVNYILTSSPFRDEVIDSGVTIRRGWIAVASRESFETVDVSMSGNLAIFRQRAARTALNRLRLLLK